MRQLTFLDYLKSKLDDVVALRWNLKQPSDKNQIEACDIEINILTKQIKHWEEIFNATTI